jgi:hypothetical protein
MYQHITLNIVVVPLYIFSTECDEVAAGNKVVEVLRDPLS